MAFFDKIRVRSTDTVVSMRVYKKFRAKLQEKDCYLKKKIVEEMEE